MLLFRIHEHRRIRCKTVAVAVPVQRSEHFSKLLSETHETFSLKNSLFPALSAKIEKSTYVSHVADSSLLAQRFPVDFGSSL